jgi:Uma2 family endonuclease
MRTSGQDLRTHDDDPTEYPVRGGLGKDWREMLVASNFRPLLQSFLEERQVNVFVGANQFIYYVRGDPDTRVLPSIYVMPNIDVTKLGYLGCWKTWQTGAIPCFALEIVSIHNWKKKAKLKSPMRHDALGTKELIVFDPFVDELRGRLRFRVYRRNDVGRLVLELPTNMPRVWSEVLGCHLQVVGQGNSQRLRIVTNETLFPTEVEAQARRADDARQRADDARQRADDAQQRADDARQRADNEARRASDAEAEIARLRAELDAMKRRG